MIYKYFDLLRNKHRMHRVKKLNSNSDINILSEMRNVLFQVDEKAKVTIGKNVYFEPGCALKVRNDAQLSICPEGDSVVAFNNNCVITCRCSISIGSNVLIGPNTLIFDHDHDYKSDDFGNNYICEPIIIEDNVWIGGNCNILKGSIIKSGAVIAAGSTVNCVVGSNCLFYNKSEKYLKQYK